VLHPEVQKKNASLAVAASSAFLASKGQVGPGTLTDEDIANGIDQFFWPGRFQTLTEGDMTWFLDSAHNEMSVEIAAEWFAGAERDLLRYLLDRYHDSRSLTIFISDSPNPVHRILIFSHINELRNAAELLTSLGTALQSHEAGVEHVIFSTYDESEGNESARMLDTLAPLDEAWKSIKASGKVWHEPTIQGAIALARKLGAGRTHTLITGSQHLVGPALRILEWTPKPVEDG
jgi:folylpolyglutamate synthase